MGFDPETIRPDRKGFVALFRSKADPPATGDETEPEPDVGQPGAPRKKDAPTPTRRQAEAARRERLTTKRTKKDNARANRAARMKAMQERDGTPEKTLMRDYIDSRRNVAEFILPGVVLLFIGMFLAQVIPAIATLITLAIYVILAAALVDLFVMWRGFKRVLAQRLPRSSTRGLFMYGMNRAIQFRKIRMPKPRIRRGERY
jgi:hypothetical protein